MTINIMTEDGPVEEALLDGYSFGDRRLEGVMFRIQVKDGKINCPGVSESSQRYMDSFTLEQVAEWQVEAEKNCRDLGDNLETADGREAWIEKSADQPTVITPRSIGKVSIEDILNHLNSPKTS
jgi:hypothetical protein